MTYDVGNPAFDCCDQLDRIKQLLERLYKEADALDKETGDNKDDLLRAGRQSGLLDVASELASILK